MPVVARREDGFGLRVAAVDLVRLEKPDRQAGNLRGAPHPGGVRTDEREVLAVGGALRGLPSEQRQGGPFESRVVRDTEYVVGGNHRVQR